MYLIPSACRMHLFINFHLPMSNINICLIIIENWHNSYSLYTRNQFYNEHVNKIFMYWEEISICATTDPKILSNNSCGPRPMRNEQLAMFQTWGLRHVLSCLNNKKTLTRSISDARICVREILRYSTIVTYILKTNSERHLQYDRYLKECLQIEFWR